MTIELRRLGSDEAGHLVEVNRVAWGEILTSEEVATRAQGMAGFRGWVAEEEGRPFGVGAIVDLRLTVPGGARVAMAGVTEVAVLPSHRRRGALRGLMAAMLDDARERGVPVAGLVPSEAPIYGQFGFGPAARAATVEVDAARARVFHGHGDSRVELVEATAALSALARLHERVCAARNGAVSRPGELLRRRYADAERPADGYSPIHFAVHRDNAGQVDGLVSYRLKVSWDGLVTTGALTVEELWAVTSEAEASLWRFCIEHDLVTRVTARRRPVDEAFPERLADPRSWRRLPSDLLWLCPLDPTVLLAARRYGRDDGLVLEIHDQPGTTPQRCWVEGGLDGATCAATTDEPDLSLSVSALAAVCLGDVPVERLQRAGLVEERTAGAVARATAMFSWSPLPWPGYVF
ncbi:MAG TPA: GNAT family N-acetyltransferase [Candidatus Binatia bacterium]|nr:GNAT family N-acetyltransferase [Candidatus Binatia bacterium]